MTTQDVISQCYVEDDVIKLPDVQLDRSVYNDVAKHFAALNGKWDRYAKGFVFPETVNVQIAFAQLQAGKSEPVANVKKLYQFFGTPAVIADELCVYLDIDKGDKVLEPSAGQGALIAAVHEYEPDIIVDCFELMPSNREVLKQLPNVNILGNDFIEAENIGQYDKIIMNPPFNKNQDIDHFRKAYDHLADGGTLVAILSMHWTFAQEKKCVAFRQWLEEIGACEMRRIERGEFKESGTMVPCIIIRVCK